MSEKNSMPKLELSPSVSIIIAGLIIAGAIVFVNLHPTPAAPATAGTTTGTATAPAANANVPAPSTSDHIIGSLNAPIVLVEYSDFQCPYCKMIYPTLQQIVSESKGQVAWIYREFPLYQIHPQAMPAADAAECIADQLGSSGFWKFADAIFADQTKMSETYYDTLAVQFGADKAKFDSCVSSHKFSARIQAETAQAQESGGTGTPFTVIINTKTGKQYPVSGALPYAQILAVINQAKNSQ